MTVHETFEACIDDLTMTYMAIGRAGPHAESAGEASWSGCRSAAGFPVSNFAIAKRQDRKTIQEIRDFCQDRQNYLLYSFLGPDEGVREDKFSSAGFRFHHVMAMLMADGDDRATSVELKSLNDAHLRMDAARFISLQFFPRQSAEAREAISMATYGSGLPTFDAISEGRRVGVAMLTQGSGVIGVYNLCVDESLRRRGFGANLVAAILNLAHRSGTPVSLQCETRLTPWYESLGFRVTGLVEVWTLDAKKPVDIIELG